MLMVGAVYASFDTKASIELKKDLNYDKVVFVMDGVTPSVGPLYGKMVTVLAESDTELGYTPDITPKANDPPLTKRRCE